MENEATILETLDGHAASLDNLDGDIETLFQDVDALDGKIDKGLEDLTAQMVAFETSIRETIAFLQQAYEARLGVLEANIAAPTTA